MQVFGEAKAFIVLKWGSEHETLASEVDVSYIYMIKYDYLMCDRIYKKTS